MVDEKRYLVIQYPEFIEKKKMYRIYYSLITKSHTLFHNYINLCLVLKIIFFFF